MNILNSFFDYLIPTCQATSNVFYVSEMVAQLQDGFASTTTVVQNALPSVLGLLGVLIGLAVAIRYVKRWIGSR